MALVKGGMAQLKLTCPAGSEPCAGRLHLESKRPPPQGAILGPQETEAPESAVIYGEKSFSVPAGSDKTVKVKLSKRAKSRLRDQAPPPQGGAGRQRGREPNRPPEVEIAETEAPLAGLLRLALVEVALEDLAGRVARQLFEELEVAGRLVGGEVRLDVAPEVVV